MVWPSTRSRNDDDSFGAESGPHPPLRIFRWPGDGLKTGDLPASFSGKKLTGMVSKTPLTQPHEFSLYAVYECVSAAQVNGFWEFQYQGLEGPKGEKLVAAVAAPPSPSPTSPDDEDDPMDGKTPEGHACRDVAEFNSLLLTWLEATTEATIGRGGGGRDMTVVIGGIKCRLSTETTRAGIRSYLLRLLSGGTTYSVVASSKGVVHRVAVGRTEERIRGFYLYTERLFERPQLIARGL